MAGLPSEQPQAAGGLWRDRHLEPLLSLQVSSLFTNARLDLGFRVTV